MNNSNNILTIVIIFIIVVLVWLIINNPFFGIPKLLGKDYRKIFANMWNSKENIPSKSSKYRAEDVVGEERAQKYRAIIAQEKKNKEQPQTQQIVYATEETMEPIHQTLDKPSECGCTTCISGQYVPLKELSDLQQNTVKTVGEFKHMSECSMNNQNMWSHPEAERKPFSYIDATNQTVCGIKGKPQNANAGCKSCGNNESGNQVSSSMFEPDNFYGYDQVAPFKGYGSSANANVLIEESGKLIKKGSYDMWKKGNDGKIYKAALSGNKLTYMPIN